MKSTATPAYCFDCKSNVRGLFAVHISTAKHQRAIAVPVVRRRSERRIRRAAAWARVDLEPSTLDDPAPTWKLCRGVPSLDVAPHFEPLERFHRNRAYPDGWYVRCHSCHQYYRVVYDERRKLAAAIA